MSIDSGTNIYLNRINIFFYLLLYLYISFLKKVLFYVCIYKLYMFNIIYTEFKDGCTFFIFTISFQVFFLLVHKQTYFNIK